MAGMFDDLVPKQPPASGGGMFSDLVPAASGTDEQSFWQQMFDVRNAQTGESYLYGNKPKPTGLDDVNRIVADTMSRGYMDKITGGNAQQMTQEARDRTSDWIEAPTDIGAAIISSPYRGAGAVTGALEGMASAYGHQDSWVPDVGNMLVEGGKGALAGGVGKQVGKWLGKTAAKIQQPFSTDDQLKLAAREAAQSGAPEAGDLASRLARVEAVRAAQGEPRDVFARMMSGMEGLTEAEAAKIAAATQPSTVAKVGEKVAPYGIGKQKPVDLLVTEMAANTLGVPPGLITGARTGASVLSKAGQSDWISRLPRGAADDIAALMRDPRGKGIDPAVIEQWRNAFAKGASGYQREP